MLLFVGLGNPGPDHAGHRHNIGYRAVEAIAARHGFAEFKARARLSGAIAEGRLGDEKVLLLEPATYMNESGRAVGATMRFFKIPLTDIVVFHDELDLAPGKLRIKVNGGNAGHHGLDSIDAHIGKAYRRARIGIGHPGDKALVTPYVLSNFFKTDMAWLDRLLPAIADAAPLLVDGGDNAFMTRVALLAQPPEPEKPTGDAGDETGDGA